MTNLIVDLVLDGTVMTSPLTIEVAVRADAYGIIHEVAALVVLTRGFDRKFDRTPPRARGDLECAVSWLCHEGRCRTRVLQLP